MNPQKTHSSTTRQQSSHPEGGNPESVDRLFAQVVGAASGIPPVHLLADLDRPGVAHLKKRWTELPVTTRSTLVQEMTTDADANVHHSYHRALLVALGDPEPAIRLAAVTGLWEYEGHDLLRTLLVRVESEENDDVRAAEASGLGQYALQAELGDLDDESAESLRTTLLRLHTNDPSITVRRRALESLGYFADDSEVIELIQRAFESGNHLLRVSALQAMGRQADTRWLDICHAELQDDEPELRYEAVTALGMIGNLRSVPDLIDIAADPDREVQLAAIAALGEIGGQMAVNTLRRLQDEESLTISEAASEALEQALIMANPLRPPL